jgi:hypothetical protein
MLANASSKLLLACLLHSHRCESFEFNDVPISAINTPPPNVRTTVVINISNYPELCASTARALFLELA